MLGSLPNFLTQSRSVLLPRPSNLQIILQILTASPIPECDRCQWHTLLSETVRHKVFSSVYPALLRSATDLPADYCQMLKADLHQNTVHSLVSFNELTRLLELLNNHGCDAIAFKGPVLSQLAYENLSSRLFRDLDL